MRTKTGFSLQEAIDSGKWFKRPNFRPINCSNEEPWLCVEFNKIKFATYPFEPWQPRATDIGATDWVIKTVSFEEIVNRLAKQDPSKITNIQIVELINMAREAVVDNTEDLPF